MCIYKCRDCVYVHGWGVGTSPSTTNNLFLNLFHKEKNIPGPSQLPRSVVPMGARDVPTPTP